MTKIDQLQQWLLSAPFGQHILQNELLFYHKVTQQMFGYYALQIGMPNLNFLENNKIRSKFVITHDIKCHLNLMPFATNSVDLIICPHTLELVDNYGQILAELYRILIAKGKLIITGFNPNSLFGLFGRKEKLLQEIQLLKLQQLKQALSACKFQINGGQFLSYTLPSNDPKTIEKLAWMNKIGDRWFPTCANAYAIVATKEMITLNRMPKQNEAFKKAPAVQLGATKTW